MKQGDCIDALDQGNKWRFAQVVQLTDLQVKVQYLGTYTQAWIRRDSSNIAPYAIGI